jgi:hypothetical protein
MTHPAPFAAPRPAPLARLAGWAGTLTRPGSGLGFWVPALSVQPAPTVLALGLLALAALSSRV